jgi:hypothetical protein
MVLYGENAQSSSRPPVVKTLVCPLLIPNVAFWSLNWPVVMCFRNPTHLYPRAAPTNPTKSHKIPLKPAGLILIVIRYRKFPNLHRAFLSNFLEALESIVVGCIGSVLDFRDAVLTCLCIYLPLFTGLMSGKYMR